MSEHHDSGYYVPSPSKWPIVGSIALLFLGLGAVHWVHGQITGPYLCGIGLVILIYMLYGWFGTLIREDRAGKLSDPQVRRSFRMGMLWFIFTEVMLFVALFGALFYARLISVPQIGGAGSGVPTHLLLWPAFQGIWPPLKSPDPNMFTTAKAAMDVWGVPAINTLIILLSGATITFGYWGVIREKRWQAILGQSLTIILGSAFLLMQVREYWVAYTTKGVKLTSGIYGSTFYMITAFDALHVFAGVIMLAVILWRLTRRDFSPKDHFGFSAVFWYWHFVEFIWLLLFVFVYWI